MKKLIQSPLLLLLLFNSSILFAQNKIFYPSKIDKSSVSEFKKNMNNEINRSRATCGIFSDYPNRKNQLNSGQNGFVNIQANSTTNMNAIYQTYEAPQEIVVSGMAFFAMPAGGAAPPIIVKVELYDKNRTLITSDNDTITSPLPNFYVKNFSTPSSVEGTYYMQITAVDPGKAVAILATDPQTNSGMGENLAWGIRGTDNISFLNDLSLDLDIFLFHFGSTDVIPDFTFTSPIGCDELTDLINTSSPILNHRMYNTRKFSEYFEGVDDTITYAWNIDGTKFQTEDVIGASFNSVGNHPVELIITLDSNCIDMKSATIAVNSVTPDVSISITEGSNPTCPGAPITFTAIPVNGGSSPTYQWQINGVDIAGATSRNFNDNSSFNDGDTITCRMTSNANCLTAVFADSDSIIMDNNPMNTLVPSVVIEPSSNPFCEGTTSTITASPSHGGLSPSFQWYVNGSPTGTNSNTLVAAFADGDEISCIMHSTLTCADPDSAISNEVTMDETPIYTPSVTIAPDSNPFCPGTSVTFTATPSNGGSNPSYQWKVNGSSSGTNNNTFTAALADGDEVSCVMTSSLACSSPATANSSSITMEQKPFVDAYFTFLETGGGQVSFTNNSTGAGTLSYTWDFGDSNTSTSTDATVTHTYAANGDYTVSLTATDECGSDVETNTVSVMTISINNHHTVKSKVIVYPNPSNGIFNVSGAENITVIVYNSIGSVIKEASTTNNRTHLTIDLSNEPNGIYFIRVATNAEAVMKKVNIIK